ncbi:MAG: hypothetical protein QXS38_01230 [Candidatus Pacearchaeota archaeon]
MIIELILLILAIPVGYLIAQIAREELNYGKVWFEALFIISIVLSGLFWLLGEKYISLTCLFIAVVSMVSVLIAKDKKTDKEKI